MPSPNPSPGPTPDPIRDAVMDSLVPAILSALEGLVYWAKSGFDSWDDEKEYRRRVNALRALSPVETKLLAEEEAQAERRHREIQAQVEAAYGKGRPQC